MTAKIATSWDAIKLILLSNRFKSFYWRGGAMLVAGFLSIILESATDLQLSNLTITVIGLILGEITKFLNTK
jgi:hypothetical protein